MPKSFDGSRTLLVPPNEFSSPILLHVTSDFEPKQAEKNLFGRAGTSMGCRFGTRANSQRSSRAKQAWRTRWTTVRGPKSEVFGTSDPEPRTSDRACFVCRALDAPRSVALCSLFETPIRRF